ncbi:MAG TPA: limonene-1,2-epoxide hydrolase family protein [Microthrixaceae bacterium]|jgi:limonene-1,2-epoxide hydrolase|nr:limonene-1,2-epoxide hydrolase family protein [Microthrixaceae bacterium]
MSVATDTATDAIAVVEEFLGAMERLDADRVVELLHPEVEYRNVPFPAAKGKRAVERQLRGFARYATGIELRTHHIAANGPIVLTERTDVIEVGRVRAAFWVCGTFEVRDGRIRLWRDRFDLVAVTWALLKGLVGALLPWS